MSNKTFTLYWTEHQTIPNAVIASVTASSVIWEDNNITEDSITARNMIDIEHISMTMRPHHELAYLFPKIEYTFDITLTPDNFAIWKLRYG
jgi:hypothetical protein